MNKGVITECGMTFGGVMGMVAGQLYMYNGPLSRFINYAKVTGIPTYLIFAVAGTVMGLAIGKGTEFVCERRA